MTSKFDRKTSVYTFSCDQPGCRRNYEAEPGQFKDAWTEARAHGWAYVPAYENGISVARHFCPADARQFDRNGG